MYQQSDSVMPCNLMGGLVSCWIIEKAREFQKNIYFCLWTTPKSLIMWITTHCGKFFKRWEYQTT